jgi:hypothetical protein
MKISLRSTTFALKEAIAGIENGTIGRRLKAALDHSIGRELQLCHASEEANKIAVGEP